MALEPCPECGNPVSSYAHACPNCGYPVAMRRDLSKRMVVFFATGSIGTVLLGLVLLGLTLRTAP